MYVPNELEGYQYDDQAERLAKRLARVMGIVTLLLLVATIVMFCLEQGTLGTVSFFIFLLVGVASCIVWAKKKSVPCRLCKSTMKLIDGVFPVEELGKYDRKWMNKPLFSGGGRSLFEGADGCVYEVNKSTSTCSFWRLSKYNLRFYVCHKCQSYFRYGNVISVVENEKTPKEIESLKQALESGLEKGGL